MQAPAKLAEVLRENSILKRAVQIQNAKLVEKAGQEQELQQLRSLLAHCQEQLHSLELSNYSLTLHLQKATSGSTIANRNPDVF
jgi:murein tripeptide amidase MpaA